MKKLYVLLCAFFIISSIKSYAQQDPQYTQYMYNMNVVNPAYAGSKESLNIGLLYRDQWSGFEGAPRTFTFSAHSPVGEKTGLGLSAISDENGPVQETNVYADFSYTLDFGKSRKLAFGIKAGATFHDVGLTGLDLQNQDDVAFAQNINDTYPNIGAGFLYYTDNWYVGVSVPNLLQSTHLDADPDGREFGNEEMHYFATAGYVFQLTENTKFKPSTLVKSSFESPLSFDVNANFLFYDRFEIGASYRYEDAVSGLASVRATDWVQFGFAYDHSISDIDQPSYEAFVIFDIFFNKKTYLSPRYF
ncbi:MULTISPECIES: PorP/SprF family type IX secretion system membrane protein [Mesonia]|uniref:Membrane protein n=1 Tax=Mesonia mobilis TaxID=369791 RepID=A0ABQ3C1Y9_9FLAO|nr:type IX secretion system membrane protein PorP/SprF [Mesonia mobilis]MBQ0738615.1 type IX secretion system membrane protein PorP/SprF [Aquimarina celericrescens]GGZ65041.1 membrane protein [Mesonia mobilis]|tara:strand:+ start:143 stop:1054 length:912 start_codon:yes stop_codon:yes gene_type:complete